jgi:hypothetical protein
LKLNNYGFSDVKTYLATQTLAISLNTFQKRARFIQSGARIGR